MVTRETLTRCSRIGPARRRRQRDLDVGADRIAGAGAELESLEAGAERGELVDRLRALVAPPGDARGEAVLLVAGAEPHVLRPHRDAHGVAGLDLGVHQRGEFVAA